MSDFLVNAGLILTYLMIGLAALAALVYPIRFLAKNPSKSKNALIGIGGLVFVCILSYLFASSDILTFPGSEKFGMTEASTKRVGMGLITFYILSAGAILSVLYAELGKFFKSKHYGKKSKRCIRN